MAKDTPIQLWRGDEADRPSETPLAGEPMFTEDERRLFIGDGSTAGGWQVGGQGNFSWGHGAGNKYITSAAFSGTAGAATFANFQLFVPFCVAQPTTFTGIGLEMATAGTGNVLLGVYENGTDGQPEALIYTSAAVPVGTAGVKTTTGPGLLTGGWYWLACLFQNTSGTVQSTSSTIGHSGQGLPTATSSTNVYNGFFQVQAYGSGLASPAGAVTNYNGAMPALFLSL